MLVLPLVRLTMIGLLTFESRSLVVDTLRRSTPSDRPSQKLLSHTTPSTTMPPRPSSSDNSSSPTTELSSSPTPDAWSPRSSVVAAPVRADRSLTVKRLVLLQQCPSRSTAFGEFPGLRRRAHSGFPEPEHLQRSGSRSFCLRSVSLLAVIMASLPSCLSFSRTYTYTTPLFLMTDALGGWFHRCVLAMTKTRSA